MAVRTRAQIKSDAAASIPDNMVEAIDPEDVRERVVDLADSAMLPEDFASDAQMRSATASRLVTADKIETASAWVAITYGATITLNWDNFINGVATLTGNPTFAAPTNLQDGVERCLLLKGNNATERVPAFNTAFKGDLPEDGATSTQWLLLTLKPSGADILVSHIVVDAS